MKYRKKPVEIEALQYTGNNFEEIRSFIGKECIWAGSENVVIHTWEGDMLALPGDWIIRGVKGEFYPCKPDIFKETYEPVAKQIDKILSSAEEGS